MRPPPQPREAMKRFFKWILGLAVGTVLVIATIILLRAFDARRQPDLKPWHGTLAAEFRAKDLTDATTLADYLRIEEAAFTEMERDVIAQVAPSDRTPYNRYSPDGLVNPLRFPKNWNHTFELVPEGPVRGGVLLMHGLTDSPYSVRAEAELYAREGFYALALRVPGHGTIPGALTVAHWEDWRAAARLGARHVRGKVPAPLPFHVVGYSNGGALAVQYALDTLGNTRLPRPDRVVVMSPMIGVTRFAGAAAVIAKMVTWRRRVPLLREVALDGRPAGVQPVQVQLVPGVRRAADRRDHAGHPGVDRKGSRERAHQAAAADPRLRFARGLDRADLVHRRSSSSGGSRTTAASSSSST